MNARNYTVFWHYVGNHGAYQRWADTPEEACRSVIRGFSDDFAAKAELVAVEGSHMMRPAKAYDKSLEVLATAGCRFTLDDGRHGIVLSRQITEHDKMLVGWLDEDDRAELPDGRAIGTKKVVEYLPADGPGCSAGNARRVLVPAGTHIIVGNTEQPTKMDVLATVTGSYDEYTTVLVDDVTALPDNQRRWNASEGKMPNHAEILTINLKEVKS